MSRAELLSHLEGGLTHVCRCWRVRRRDGIVFGFTDHDRAIRFDGTEFRADAGMTARALVQGTGLAVDNTEALGVLSDSSIREADIEAGRFDGAGVEAWLVNWRDPEQRMLRFAGRIGEIRRGGGAFTAELRGLSDLLNQPRGRVYHPGCAAVLGDHQCRVDLSLPGMRFDRAAETVERAQQFRFAGFDDAADAWFARGMLRVLSGPAAGLSGVVKSDRLGADGTREITLWQPLRARVNAGDMLRIEAGCDKRAETCRLKFANIINFRGFPTIPGEDWLIGSPVPGGG